MVYGIVFGDAENAVVVLVALLNTLDEYALTCFEDIDSAPLEESYVGELMTCEEVAAVI